MASTPGYTDADMDPAFRRRRLRAVKRSIDSIPSARIPELENFVATLRPTPLPLEIEEGSQPAWLEPFRELARGWSLPAMNELDKLDDRDLARMRLLSWLMRQEPEDKSRDWGGGVAAWANYCGS